MTLYLFGLFGLIALAGHEALRDKTPRRPYVWSRPGLSWWAAKRTSKELARTAIAMGADKQA